MTSFQFAVPAQPHPLRCVLDSSFERALSRLLYNLRMGNRLNERTRRTDQPYPQPGHPGEFSHQDGDRNPRPGHPGASLKQDGDRNPRPRHPGDFPHQDGDRSPRPEHSVASLHRNEGACLSIILILSSMFNSSIDIIPFWEGYIIYDSS